MRILVTGGAGFIGSNFIRYMLARYPRYFIINYDKLTYAGNLENLRDVELSPNYKFVKGDICDRERVDEVIKRAKITQIVNFAAESHVDRSILGPGEFVITSIVGTQVLLDVARENKIEHFHHISTDEVFGALPLGIKIKFNLGSNYDPRSPYSASKASSDHLVRAYFWTYGLPITISNASNNYGPFQDPEKFISRTITNLIVGEPAPVYGDGKYVRDWLFVEDHCRAIDLILHKGKVGETYLIGGLTKDFSNLEVIKKILKIFGISVNITKDSKFVKYVKDRAGHDRRYAVDWAKIKKELKWNPMNDFDRGLAKTVEWYKNNEWWWRPLKKESEKLYEKTGQK